MSEEKSIFKTTIKVEVLSDNELSIDSLEALGRDCVYGDYSCDYKVEKSEELFGQKAIDAINAQNTSPAFFGFDEE